MLLTNGNDLLIRAPELGKSLAVWQDYLRTLESLQVVDSEQPQLARDLAYAREVIAEIQSAEIPSFE
jgi:hypothetical protein